MKLLLFLCFMLSFLNFLVFAAPDPQCDGVGDFAACKPPITLNCNNSQCFCKDGTPFCRCLNYKDTWYLGENCDQKWTVVTFALVASLPGVCLAAIVGVIVHFVNQMSKSSKKSKGSKGTQPHMAQTFSNGDVGNQDGSYSNMVFASDLPNRPVAPRIPLPQDRMPMAPMGRPFSTQSNEMGPPFDRTALPPSNANQHYNHGAGMNQPTANPYSRSPVLRDPYENRAPPPNRYDDRMRPSYPPQGQNMMRGDMSGFPGANIPPPTQPAPYRNPSFQIPKAQMGRLY